MIKLIAKEDGTLFGSGATRDEAFQDAIDNAMYDAEWLKQQITKGDDPRSVGGLCYIDAIDDRVLSHLAETYGVEEDLHIRYIDDPDYGEGAIEVYGTMPNSDAVGWWFAGYEAEILRNIAAALLKNLTNPNGLF
jgi:hypothetical protein